MRHEVATRLLAAALAVTGMLSGVAVLRGTPSPSAGSVTAPPVAAQLGRGVPAAVTEQDPARAAAVTVLLDSWATAVRTADTAALARLVDRSADPGFLAAEQRRAADLRGVPLSDWGYEIGPDPAPTVPPALATRLGADEVWAPPVVLRYAVAGADATATRKPVGLVVARRGSSWFLVSDTDLVGYGRTTWRGPWDFGPVVVRSSAQGVVLGHPGQESGVDELAAELVTAVPAVTSFWGPDWPQRALVVLAGSQPELESMVGTAFAGRGVAAVTTADSVDRAAGTATGVRVVFNPATMDQLRPDTLRVVLRHELTHVAARAVTVDQSPLWMSEGFADYSGYRGSGTALAQGAPAVAGLVRSSGAPDALPADADFATSGSGASAEVAYQLAWTFAVFLAQTRGEDALRAAYRAVAVLPSPTADQLDAAVEPTLGAPLATIVAEWGRWLVAEVG